MIGNLILIVLQLWFLYSAIRMMYVIYIRDGQNFYNWMTHAKIYPTSKDRYSNLTHYTKPREYTSGEPDWVSFPFRVTSIIIYFSGVVVGVVGTFVLLGMGLVYILENL